MTMEREVGRPWTLTPGLPRDPPLPDSLLFLLFSCLSLSVLSHIQCIIVQLFTNILSLDIVCYYEYDSTCTNYGT